MLAANVRRNAALVRQLAEGGTDFCHRDGQKLSIQTTAAGRKNRLKSPNGFYSAGVHVIVQNP